jgi:hypothetical protein
VVIEPDAIGGVQLVAEGRCRRQLDGVTLGIAEAEGAELVLGVGRETWNEIIVSEPWEVTNIPVLTVGCKQTPLQSHLSSSST